MQCRVITVQTRDGFTVDVSTILTSIGRYETVVFLPPADIEGSEEQFYGIFETPDLSFSDPDRGRLIADEVQQMTLAEMRARKEKRFG